MKIKDLASAFDTFEDRPISVVTTIQNQTKDGVGNVSFQGFIVDKDDFMLYIGHDKDDAVSCVSWAQIAAIEFINMEEEHELLHAPTESGSRN